MESAFASPFDFSQSSLQDYVDCPRRFQLRYLDRMTWPAVEAEPAGAVEDRQQEGLQFHRLVHQHMLGLPPELLAESAQSPNLHRWWQNYLSADLGLGDYVRRTEVAMFSPVGEHRLVAKYDLIAARDGQAIIYDWKTYARRPSNESLAARWQTRVYRALLARAGASLNNGDPLAPDSIRMIYWFAEFPAEPAAFNYDARQFGTDWAEIERLIREISTTQTFPLTEDRRRCRLCAFRSYCDRGERAAPWNEAETEFDVGDTFDISFEDIQEIEV